MTFVKRMESPDVDELIFGSDESVVYSQRWVRQANATPKGVDFLLLWKT